MNKSTVRIETGSYKKFMKKPKILAILPARGGSKRIPKKNIKEFCGKPMIAWPIHTLQSCGLIDDILVSTDSTEIQEIVTSLNVRRHS